MLGPPAQPKLGFDSHAGWFAYAMPHGQMFVKRFEAFPNRVYGEIASLTVSLWYPPASFVPACELEPIGPRNDIPPGGSARIRSPPPARNSISTASLRR